MIVNKPTDAALKQPSSPPLSMVSGQNDRMAGSVPVWDKFSSFVENLADADGEGDKKASFGFSDIVDMVNPLQHIPVVSSLYQGATGDTIGAIAKIIGGAIFGGPIGALTSAGMVAYQAAKSENSNGFSVDELSGLQGTTVALADMRAGYSPYNT